MLAEISDMAVLVLFLLARSEHIAFDVWIIMSSCESETKTEISVEKIILRLEYFQLSNTI